MPAPAITGSGGFQPRQLVINVDNENYRVYIYPENDGVPFHQWRRPYSLSRTCQQPSPLSAGDSGALSRSRKVYLTKDLRKSTELGTRFEGDIVGYIESMKTYNAVAAEGNGQVIEICFSKRPCGRG